MKIEFIIEPQDILHAEMDNIRGGISDSADIECKSPGRIKCKKDGNIKAAEDDSAFVLSIF